MEQRWLPSSRNHPCPICGRTRDGDCRVRGDGQMVFCHRGKSQGPPERLRAGEVLTDSEGRRWAYTGESRDGSRDGAVFVIDEEKSPTITLPACPPPAPPAPAPAVRDGIECYALTYYYRDNLRVIRYDFATGKKKEFLPQHCHNGQWIAGAGSEVWPFYGSLGEAGTTFVVEVEGEKCVDVLRSCGIAAITHPGHQRDEPSCRARYEGLLQASVTKVYFISDNDVAGRKKGAGFAAAARLAGVEFVAITAESIYAVPDGGSVDDMPPEQLGSLIAGAIKSASSAKIAPLTRTSYAKAKKSLEEFLAIAPESAADVQTGIADIASAHDISVFDASRIWDSLQQDQQIEADALSATAAIVQRRDLELRRKSIDLHDYLPDDVCSAIEVLTGNLACDALASAAVVLTTAAGVFKAGHRIDAGDGLFVKQPVIWCLLAGASGSGKSPIMQHLCSERLGLVLSHYHNVSMDMEIEWESRYGMLPKARRPEKPDSLETCVTDFTTERLNTIIVNNHEKGLATFIYSEEVKEILGNFDEYKSSGKGRGKEAFLCLFDGKVNSQHRVGRKSKPVVGKVQNALLGAVQPGVFRRMVEEGDDAGLFARCLMLPVVNEYVEPNFFRSPAEIQSVHIAQKTLENFYLRCLDLNPLVLRLDGEAIELFMALHRDTYEKAKFAPLESQRAVYGKRLGYVLQVALTMHLCGTAAGHINPDNLYVSKQTLAHSVKFVDLLQSYAIVEQQESQMQRHGSFDLSRRIHTYAQNGDGCTVSQFTSNCIPIRWRREIKSSHVKAAMDQLVATGLGEWRDKAIRGKSVITFVALGRFPD